MIALVALFRRLPRRLDALSYSLPAGMPVARGDLVSVPFRGSILRGVVLRVSEGPEEKLRPVEALVTRAFLSEANLAVLEQTAEEIVQSTSTLLHAAFPAKPTPKISHTYPSISVRREEIPYIQQAVGMLTSSSSFIQVTDMVQAAAIAHAMVKKEPRTCVLVPHHHDARLIPSVTRLGSLNIAPDTRQILVLRSGSPEHAQYDRNPRYDAREVGRKMARQLSCPIGYIDVCARATDLHLCEKVLELPTELRPEPIMVDLKHERGKDFFLLSDTLVVAIQEALQNNKKVILSYNRKGLSRSLECRDCGWIAPSGSTAERCETCQGVRLASKGIGNQLLERELKKRFTDTPIVRIERGAKAEARVMGPAILLVTQYYFESVLNPLDASHIGLVADVRADLGLLDAWYTSVEQTLLKLCLLQGLAWRAKASFLLQTFDAPLTRRMMTSPLAFMKEELETRRTFDYPPFHALYRIDGKLQSETAIQLEQLKQLDDRILIERNPEKPSA